MVLVLLLMESHHLFNQLQSVVLKQMQITFDTRLKTVWTAVQDFNLVPDLTISTNNQLICTGLLWLMKKDFEPRGIAVQIRIELP